MRTPLLVLGIAAALAFTSQTDKPRLPKKGDTVMIMTAIAGTIGRKVMQVIGPDLQ